MPAMTAQLWENLSGLQGLGWAAREGWRAEPWPLLSASAVSPAGGNSEGCCSLCGAGGLLWEQCRVCRPRLALPDSSLRGEGVGERRLFPSSVPALPSVIGVLVCDFDLLPLSLQLSSLLLPHCGGWAVSPMTLCV